MQVRPSSILAAVLVTLALVVLFLVSGVFSRSPGRTEEGGLPTPAPTRGEAREVPPVSSSSRPATTPVVRDDSRLPADREGLLRVLRESGEPARRVRAADALARLGDATAAPDLLRLFREEKDWRVRLTILEAAAALGGPEVDALLLDILHHPDDESREGVMFGEVAAAALAGRGTQEALGILDALIRSGGSALEGHAAETGRVLSLEALAEVGSPAGVRVLEAAALDRSLPRDLRSEVLRSLGAVDDESAGTALRSALEQLLQDGGDPPEAEEDLRCAAIRSLGQRGPDPESTRVLQPLVTGERKVPDEVLRAAMSALGRIGGAETASSILAVAQDPDVSHATRTTAWIAYARAAGAASVPALEAAAGKGEFQGRAAAVKAMARVPGEEAAAALRRIAESADDPRIAELAKNLGR